MRSLSIVLRYSRIKKQSFRLGGTPDFLILRPDTSNWRQANIQEMACIILTIKALRWYLFRSYRAYICFYVFFYQDYAPNGAIFTPAG